MSRKRKPGAPKGSPEWRQRISDGQKRAHQRKAEAKEREREAARVYPRDLALLRSTGTVSGPLLPLFEVAELENLELLDAIGGDVASPQRKAILQDAVRVGMVLRAELARYLQGQDPDAGARVGSLATARRSSLVALGLDRLAQDVVDLQTYIDSKAQTAEDGVGGPNGDGESPKVEVVDDRA